MQLLYQKELDLLQLTKNQRVNRMCHPKLRRMRLNICSYQNKQELLNKITQKTVRSLRFIIVPQNRMRPLGTKKYDKKEILDA